MTAATLPLPRPAARYEANVACDSPGCRASVRLTAPAAGGTADEFAGRVFGALSARGWRCEPAPGRCLCPAHAPAGLWALVPPGVRAALRAGAALDCEQHATGERSVVARVGPGAPWRWLQLQASESGEVEARLWEARRAGGSTRGAAGAVVAPADLPALLLKWAAEFGLTAG